MTPGTAFVKRRGRIKREEPACGRPMKLANWFFSPDGIRGLDWRHLKWMFTTPHMTNYTPLAWLSYACVRAAFGKERALTDEDR